MKDLELFVIHKILIINILIFFNVIIICSFTFGQSSVNITGGTSAGNQGSVTYSIGQVFYQHYQTSGGRLAQGVQHPYEIFVLTGVNETDIDLRVLSYPNPARDYVVIEIKKDFPSDMYVQIFDISGRWVMTQPIIENYIKIDIQDIHSAALMMLVYSGDDLLKSFKVIKTN
jgi:hypothetical protein